ncbi:ATP-dependent Clp protease adaptor ClpS [Actinokineospora sp. NPDC004072]
MTWPVSIVNDDTTSVAVVAHALTAVCGLPFEQAAAAVQQADRAGRAQVAALPDRESAEAVVVRL